mmetsp:Transcript_38401/g.91743  ORF Transcript_38401/g.91743 Transcript_38401/m.91743 type:complete len:459 (+) Transcript_38401:293-1669(+)
MQQFALLREDSVGGLVGHFDEPGIWHLRMRAVKELLHNADQMREERRQVGHILHLRHLPDWCQGFAELLRIADETVHQQSAALQPLPHIRMIPTRVFQQLLELRDFRADPSCLRLGIHQRILSWPAGLLLLELMEPPLRLSHGVPQLLVLRITVQELVHNIHDVCQACDLPDPLKAILSGLTLLGLVEGQALQAVACKLLDGVDLPVAAGSRLEGFCGCLHGHLVAPVLEVLPLAHVLLAPLDGRGEVANGGGADHALKVHVLLQNFQLHNLPHLVLVDPAAEVLLRFHLPGLAVQVAFHQRHLLLKDVLLADESFHHVPVHLLRLQRLLQLHPGLLELVRDVLAVEAMVMVLVLVGLGLRLPEADVLTDLQQLRLLPVCLAAHLVEVPASLGKHLLHILRGCLSDGALQGIYSSLHQLGELVFAEGEQVPLAQRSPGPPVRFGHIHLVTALAAGASD